MPKYSRVASPFNVSLLKTLTPLARFKMHQCNFTVAKLSTKVTALRMIIGYLERSSIAPEITLREDYKAQQT